jgi:multidrug efflux system membrane fusion protein
VEGELSEVLESGSPAPSRPRQGRAATRLLLLLLLVGAAIAAYRLAVNRGGQASAPAASAAPAVPVTVGPATTRDLPIWLSGIGSVQPLNAVTVKVRVDGQLDRVAFTEGQEVHAGDVLAQIDPRPFQAQLKQVEANRAKDQAQLANARVDLVRFTKLTGLGAAPSQNVDTLKAQVASLEATVLADEAMIDTARLNLGFTSVTSPIDGRVGLRLVDSGSIVHAADPNGLVTVTQMQPITILFSLPQDDLPDVLAAASKGKPAVAAFTRDGARSLAQGELVFVDSQVDQTNGEVRLKAVFANADRSLWPGEFVSARLLVRTDHSVIVVPSRAVLRGQDGTYVYVLKPDQTVEVRPVQTGSAVDGVTALLAGIAPGETVVVDGQSRLAPGAKADAKQAPTAAAPGASS